MPILPEWICGRNGGPQHPHPHPHHAEDHRLGSNDRPLSLWAPILLGILGGGGAPNNPRTTTHQDHHSNSNNDAVEEEEEEEEEEDHRGIDNVEAIIRRRRRIRRSSAAVLQLLQGLRAGLLQSTHPEDNERETERDRVILVNPFNQAIILQGSFDVDDQTQTQTLPPATSLGDYLIGPGLDLLLQHLAENDPSRQGTPPANKEAVEAMPTLKIDENLQCSVCLDDFEIGGEAKEMPCKHKFHAACIMPWLHLHSSCPVCRFQMPAEAKFDVNGDGSEGSRSRTNNSIDNNLIDHEGDGGNGNGNGRRTNWFSVPWPFNGLFSSSTTPGGSGGGGGWQTSFSSSPASQNANADEN
ncbi:hypothetical protein Sjap_012097 [Stephania japonica]|uniref:RING-type E3 ubiquitin transferase n=1 Tax=Stephania japonica TaxID=461633 RepID=A0AAP0IW31_9MAGN